jgi:DNA-binding transcriptional LysR family regulator
MGKLTLESLELIDAIDRRGSFSAAADELHKVPSTISYTVAKMEEDLKVPLFLRNGPRIEITEAGRELLREGRVLLQAAADLECRVQRVASGWESSLQIALDGLVPVETLAPAIAAFNEVADATRLRFQEEALTGTWESLLDGRSDLVLAVGPGPAGGGYLAREVGQVEFWFCVAPFHPLARVEEPLSEAQLRAYRAVAVADSARRLPVRSAGLLSGQRTLTVPSLRTKLRLQVEGVGVGYLPTLCARGCLEAGLLVRKRVEHEREPERLSLAWRARARGKALEWWVNRLTDSQTLESVLASAGRLYSTGISSGAAAERR